MMRVVIVGAGYAGLTCALRFARKARGRAAITLVNASGQFIERIRLHEQATGRTPPRLELAELVRDTGVKLELGWVDRVDLPGRSIQLGDRRIAWDQLVLALGSECDTSLVPGAAQHAFTLEPKSMPWLEAAVPAIAQRGGRMVVVGGGLTGIEAAAELAEQHPNLRVSLVTRGEIGPECGSAARAYIRETLCRLGVELREHVGVEAVEAGRLRTGEGELPFSACLWTVGFRAPALAREAGLDVNARGQVFVDDGLRARGNEDVHIAGDFADYGALPVPMGCKSAFPTGMHVAENLARMLDGRLTRAFSYRQVPYCISLGRRAAVVQLPVRSGVPSPRFARGRVGAALKEFICRGTVWTLRAERQGARLSQGVSLRRRPLLPAATDDVRS